MRHLCGLRWHCCLRGGEQLSLRWKRSGMPNGYLVPVRRRSNSELPRRQRLCHAKLAACTVHRRILLPGGVHEQRPDCVRRRRLLPRWQRRADALPTWQARFAGLHTATHPL